MKKYSIIKTKFKDLCLIDYKFKNDLRGSFVNVLDQELQKILKIKKIYQINISKNIKKGTLRGIHFQKKPYEEEKIIKCLTGKIFDVVIDLRKNSKTYLNYFTITLKPENKMLFIPRGFAHGFQTLSDNTSVMYLHGNKYSPEYQSGIAHDSKEFDIKWPLSKKIISLRDKKLQKVYEL